MNAIQLSRECPFRGVPLRMLPLVLKLKPSDIGPDSFKCFRKEEGVVAYSELLLEIANRRIVELGTTTNPVIPSDELPLSKEQLEFLEKHLGGEPRKATVSYF